MAEWVADDSPEPLSHVYRSFRRTFFIEDEMPFPLTSHFNPEGEMPVGYWDPPVTPVPQKTTDGIPIRKLYIGNLDKIRTTCKDLRILFQNFGTVVRSFVRYLNYGSQRPATFGFVTFLFPHEASRVLELPYVLMLHSRQLKIAPAKSHHQPLEAANGEIKWNPPRQLPVSRPEVPMARHLGPRPKICEEKPMGPCLIDTLNDDCLYHIFSFLSLRERVEIEKVCKRWRVLNLGLWRTVHEIDMKDVYPYGGRKAEEMVYSYLVRSRSALKRFCLNHEDDFLSRRILFGLGKLCHNIEELQISNVNFELYDLGLVTEMCCKIRKLTLQGCHHLTDAKLDNALRFLPELTDLDLSGSALFKGSGLQALVSPLRSLILNECCNLNADDIIAALNRLSASLQSLSLNSMMSLHCDDVARLVAAAPHLTSLSLAGLILHHVSVQDIALLTNLRTLDLSLNSGVTDDLLRSVAHSCRHIDTLSLSGCGSEVHEENFTPDGLVALGRLRHLTMLTISYLVQATDDAIIGLVRASTVSPLRRLEARGCPALSDTALTNILTFCSNLEELDISGCNRVTDASIATALQLINMRTNNVPLMLVIGGCQNITEAHNDADVPLLTFNPVNRCMSQRSLTDTWTNQLLFFPADELSDDDDDSEEDDEDFHRVFREGEGDCCYDEDIYDDLSDFFVEDDFVDEDDFLLSFTLN